MKITLPEPPSANRYWRHAGGKTFLSKAARQYKAAVKLLTAAANLPKLDVTRSCAVTVRWFRARKSGDLDNRLKIVLDALQGIAYEWDSQVVELHAYRADDKEYPRVEIEITETFPFPEAA